jgi:hypothetical protein
MPELAPVTRAFCPGRTFAIGRELRAADVCWSPEEVVIGVLLSLLTLGRWARHVASKGARSLLSDVSRLLALFRPTKWTLLARRRPSAIVATLE